MAFAESVIGIGNIEANCLDFSRRERFRFFKTVAIARAQGVATHELLVTCHLRFGCFDITRRAAAIDRRIVTEL